MSTNKKRYADIILEIIPRLLSSLDTNKHSHTFGCFDKAYWLYKTSDIPCARFQEPVLTLALLYSYSFNGNIYYRNERIREYAIAGIRFLSKIQNRDGSFNEWYPNEHSYVGTAFPLYFVSEAFRTLELKNDKLVKAFSKGGNWLGKTKDEEQPSNQVAGAIAALHNIYVITGDERYRKLADRKLRGIKQSVEGWFPEYGGPDLGYLTLTIDFLAKYWKDSKNKRALQRLESALSFLKYFIHPDGSLGGVYGSRNTEFKVPYGLEILSKQNRDADYAARMIYENIERTLNPSMMDERFALQYHSSYLQAFLENLRNREVKESRTLKLDSTKLFKDSGLFVHNNGRYYFISNLKKAGVFRLFKNNGEQVCDDSGIVCSLGKDTLATQWNDSSEYRINGNKTNISGKFVRLCPTQRLSPQKNILLRSILLTMGNVSHSAIKKMFRKKLIKAARKTGIVYEREIELQGDRVIVTDDIKNPHGLELKNIHLSSGFVSPYVPTAHFFKKSDIIAPEKVGLKLSDFPVKRTYRL